jgi:branched-chain amino acid transport system substrate-binding protein
VQVALKSHFLLLSPGSTDATADHANVPWLFSLPPSDDAIAPLLAAAVAREAASGPFAVVAGTDHDSRAALASLRRALASHAPSIVVEVTPEEDPAAVGRRLQAAAPRVVVVLAPAGRAGRCVASLRAAGFEGVILGSAPLGRAAFARVAGRAADGTIVPLLAASGPQADRFAAAYEAHWGQRPDATAALGYDAVRLAAAAVRRAGLNRPLIRDAVRSLAPWPGASGVVRWNALGRNEAPLRLGRWRDGRLEPLPASN